MASSHWAAPLILGTLPPADCKYKFESWGACDGGTGTKARQGTLKKARYNAQCQETIRVTKPCTPKTKAKAKGQGSGRGLRGHGGGRGLHHL